jgi:two-component system sensor histidine kinase SenX3
MTLSLRRRMEMILARLDPQRAARLDGAAEEELLGAIEAATVDATQAANHAAVHAAGLAQVVEMVGNGVVICNASGELVYRNARAVALVGGQGGDLIADRAIENQLADTLAGRSGERLLELFAPSRRTLGVRSCPLHSDAGQILGAVAVIEDMSERQRIDKIRRDFVANVSHELKTPVGALSLLAETLDGEDDPETVARLTARLGAEAGRLGRIIDDLLDLSRIEANEEAPLEEMTVGALVAEAVEPLRPAARSREIELRTVEIPSDLILWGHHRDLVSAVANLVDNAIKYSEPRSPVTVCARASGDTVEIIVSDQGLGIPPRDLERIFERFYRVDRARSRATGGTGLGLSIVRHVAVNHGGTVSVESAEGQGSTFTLRFPSGSDRGHNGDGERANLTPTTDPPMGYPLSPAGSGTRG